MRSGTQVSTASVLILFLSVAFFVWAKTSDDKTPAQKANDVRVHYVALAQNCNIPLPAKLFGGVGDANVMRLQRMSEIEILKSAQSIIESGGLEKLIARIEKKNKNDDALSMTDCISASRYISLFIENNRGSDALGDTELLHKQIDRQ